jgi:hypothetical protein
MSAQGQGDHPGNPPARQTSKHAMFYPMVIPSLHRLRYLRKGLSPRKSPPSASCRTSWCRENRRSLPPGLDLRYRGHPGLQAGTCQAAPSATPEPGGKPPAWITSMRVGYERVPSFSRRMPLASVEKLHNRSLAAKLWSWRYIVLRRISQFGILLMFFGTAHWGWQVAKEPPLLSGKPERLEIHRPDPAGRPARRLADIPDRTCPAPGKSDRRRHRARHLSAARRAHLFCAWVCPVNVVTDPPAGCATNGYPTHVPRAAHAALLHPGGDPGHVP